MKIFNSNRNHLYSMLALTFDSANIKPKAIELGVLRGDNALKINEILKPQSLVLVDAWSSLAFQDYFANNSHRDWVESLNNYADYFGGPVTEQATMDRLYETTKNKFISEKNVSILREDTSGAYKKLAAPPSILKKLWTLFM